jgi:hypothetical protein
MVVVIRISERLHHQVWISAAGGDREHGEMGKCMDFSFVVPLFFGRRPQLR